MAIDLSGGLPDERDYFYAERPGAEVRDAANIWIEEENGDFAMRIGIEGLAEDWERHELWLDIAFADGRVISGRERGDSHSPIDAAGHPAILGTGPLEFRCVEPFRRTNIRFAPHPVRELSTAILASGEVPDNPPMRTVAFEIDVRPAVPPLVSGTLTAESADLMSGEQGSFISPRFEQLCRVTGTLTIDGETRSFRGQGLRIKRQGVRRFEGFWGHCWQSALFPGGRAFGVNAFPPREDGKPSFNEGFVFDGDGALQPARATSLPWMRELFERGEPVPLVLETADGQTFEIEGETFVNCRSLGGVSFNMPPEWPVVQQAHAHYRWDGEEATGMVERSTLRKHMRI